MKAQVLHRFGDSNQFALEDIEKPVPQQGQVLIQIKAIGINPVDTKVRNGSNRIAQNMDLPAVIGWDAAGIIVACGKGVSGYRDGDEVFGCIGFPGNGGAYAAFAVADTKDIAKKPEKVSFEEAAALPIVGLTAFQAIHEHLDVQSGQKMLLQAAAGGVGHLALQLAKLKGATVIGTASERNKTFLEDLGIDQMINYKEKDFEDYAKDVDGTLDAMGGEVLHRSIRCTKQGGKVVCLPSSTKNDPEATALAKERDIALIWPIMYVDHNQLQEMANFLASGKMKIHIGKVFPLEEMSKAHQAVETQRTRGKMVVRV